MTFQLSSSQPQSRSQSCSLVLLRGGERTPPIFVAHGIGGTAMQLFRVVHHFDQAHPVYAMQARGVDGTKQPLDSIELMALFHTSEIQEVQPHGPYFLIGYSLGGLVALEIARNLIRMGSRVGLLAMVDSYPHSSKLRLEQRFRLLARAAGRSAARFAATIVRRPSPQVDSYEKSNSTHALQHVRHCADRALRRYRPSFYPGSIKFIRAETITTFPQNPVDAWAPFAGHFEVETIPGDHVGMITEHSRDLALVLNRYIRGAR